MTPGSTSARSPAPAVSPVVDNAIATYYEAIREAIGLCRPRPGAGFDPGFELPELDDRMRELFAPSGLGAAELPPYGDCSLRLLNLMRNPGTRTTKTFASLLMVARAVRWIRSTGEPIMILTPTSGNKGTALRDAVQRALELGLVSAEQLRIVTIVPRSSLPKLWSSALSEDPDLRRRNPVLLYDGPDPEAVKALGRELATDWADEFRERFGLNVWYTLDLDNYRVADSIRAYFEHEWLPAPDGRVRVHAHAVSSAYGLLGYHLGRQVLAQGGTVGPDPQLFLVQHLAAPDMVLSLRFGEFARDNMPRYALDDLTGLYVQSDDPSFPSTAYALDESIDSTFYTHEPPTSELIDAIVDRQGGAGVVVSLHECLSRYGAIRRLVPSDEVRLPSDPRLLREWALVMVLTGVMNGIDRGLVPSGADVVVHASGSYWQADFTQLDPGDTVPVHRAEDVERAVLEAAGAPVGG